MTISTAPNKISLRQRMMAALELSWEAACWEVPGLLPVDRENMEQAIFDAAAVGERDFTLLQRRAIEASRGAKTARPIERRLAIRLPRFDGDRRAR